MNEREQPVNMRVERLLRERIARGVYSVGSFLPSERRLEQELGASRISIRQALGRLRQRGIIEKSDRKRSMVKRLPAAKSSNVAFAAPYRRDSQLEVYRMFFDSLFLLCNQVGHNLFYVDLSGTPTDFILSLHYDAIFIVGDCGVNADLKRMISIDTVVISLDDLKQPLADLTVCADNRKCGELAAETLLDSDCENLAFIGVKDTYDSYHPNLLRLQGFTERLRVAEMPFGENARLDIAWPVSQEEYAAQVAAFLRKCPRIDGIFAYNDGLAIRTLKALGDMGINVPGQISVVGLDGLEMGIYTSPALTTVAQPIHQVIETAVAKIGFDRQELRATETIKLPPTLMIRESTKPLLKEGKTG